MRRWKRLTWGVLGATALVGCAGGMPRELLDARYAYQRASTGPAAQYSPAYLAEARAALDEANRSFERSKGSEQTRTLAYVALRKAQIAETRAQIALAERERAQADQQLQASRSSEQEKLRRELEAARAQLTEAQAMREEAQRREAEVSQQQEEQAQQEALAAAQRVEEERAARLADAEARMNQLNAQLEAERQARSQAEQRAAQAEADAKAQAEAAAALRNIRQVKVKEEARGLVLTLSGSVLFRSGSADLLPSAKRRLDEVARALQKASNPLVIEGHTDSQGGEALNEELSNRRAEVVRDYLIDRGVEGDRIRALGLGESRPVASNGTPEGRANNRRVEIVIERGDATGTGGAGEPGTGGAGEEQTPPQPQPEPGTGGAGTEAMDAGTGGSGTEGETEAMDAGTGGSGTDAMDAGTGGAGVESETDAMDAGTGGSGTEGETEAMDGGTGGSGDPLTEEPTEPQPQAPQQ
ncbi:MAG TPA: OmpA family protein [Aggregicoccus sp.]|nr:OmpA family protein [Aggregicoccus sp.]